MPSLNEVIQKQITSVNGLVTKSVVVAELVDVTDGDKKLVVLGSDCPLWDAVGMLEVIKSDLIDMYVNIEMDEVGEE